MRTKSPIYWLSVVLLVLGCNFSFISQSDSASKDHWSEEPPAVPKVQGLDPEQMDQLFTNLAEAVSSSVVNIYSTSKVQMNGRRFGRQMQPDDFFDFFFGNPLMDPFSGPPERESTALGSGFIINSDGYIVTNSHVVRPMEKNADMVRVKFMGERRGEGVEAKIVGVDPTTDVALLKVKSLPKNLKIASLGDSTSIKPGNWVIAIGNPYGHAHSVTQGIISALGRNIPGIGAEFIQTSASINPGNSGGPLINLKGQVIGINTAIDPRAQGIGFAIPINSAKPIIRQLIEKGEVTRGWLGIGISNLAPGVADQLGVKQDDGALVNSIEPGQPADKAGLKVYDVVTEVNGKAITSAQELITTVGAIPIGQSVKLKVIRDGKTKEITATVGQRPSTENIARSEAEENGRGGGVDLGKTGLVLVELSEPIRRKLGVPSSVKGVFVERVLPHSVGAQAQIREGDIISEINRKPVVNVKQAEKELEIALKKEKKLLLRIVTNMGSRIVFLNLSDR